MFASRLFNPLYKASTYAKSVRYAGKVMKTPTMGDSISEGTIQSWEKNIGDRVEIGDILATVETDKITVEIPAEFSGVLSKIFVPAEEFCIVGEPLVEIDPEGAQGGSMGAGHAVDVIIPSMGDSITGGTISEIMVQVGDSVKKDDEILMIETDKITVPVLAPEDGVVLAHLEAGTEVEIGQAVMQIGQPGDSAAPVEKKAAKKDPVEIDPLGRAVAIKPMSRMRQTVASRLKMAQNTAASLTTFNEVDMSFIMDARKKHGQAFLDKNGVKLGFMSFFLKACTIALQEFPDINSQISEDGKSIKVFPFNDISVAVASPSGLVVPVLRNCQDLNLSGLEKELGALATKAREGKITMEDMNGGNFTISNGGIFGSVMGTPILNPPQSAILGMHGIHDRAVVRDGKVVARPMMYLALTYDHRIVDGRESVLFLKRVKELVENPGELGLSNEI